MLAWRREANKKGRMRKSKRYPLSDKFQSTIDKEIFHLDWSLRPGWSCERGPGVFSTFLIFSNGDKEWNEHSLARERNNELQKIDATRHRESSFRTLPSVIAKRGFEAGSHFSNPPMGNPFEQNSRVDQGTRSWAGSMGSSGSGKPLKGWSLHLVYSYQNNILT